MFGPCECSYLLQWKWQNALRFINILDPLCLGVTVASGYQALLAPCF